MLSNPTLLVVTTLLVGTSAQGFDKNGSFVTLNDGLQFASASFGLQVYDDGTAKTLTGLAIQAGFRNFFASVLAGNQAGFGQAINASTIERDEFFICGSVNTGSGGCSGFDDCKTQTAAGCDSNIQTLALDYVDMIMLDYPANDCPSILGQWAAFEAMLAANKTRSIAVSNFSPEQLDCIVSNKSLAVPAVNQMPYSIGSGSDTTVADNAKRGVVVQAYSPLGGGSLPGDPDCVAIGKAHGKSGAQVALRWIVQRNATFTTQAQSLDYFQEDVAIYDFELTAAEMAKLNSK